ncbi:serine/threonine protein kinase [Amycolatopsis antarctica]|uniref:non-specific serine/threonine protein kinase n=1 Tax=Amycolatopsis antarctica TaxID=1854586 RepID=A0A263D7I7_9PSEU|nr:Stk1 family PASTA domain-containing Ser/Thr kinase [Amycolatopsis antarctica]OZM74440.1 serine/threonine protein kinase [Amycolatopsis antarctica]
MTRTDTGLIGALLDRRYRVDRLIARGGMSSVYRGVDTRLDRAVAVKVMDPRFADDRSFVERFEREARSAARLHHPHVVAVHDQGVDRSAGPEHGRVFLVMELVDGGTLRDLIDSGGALDHRLALSVLEPVLSALAVAHGAGLVHRDVKPENVLIGPDGNPGTPAGGGVVKVADFGLVRAVSSAGTTSASIILGTVAYLAPEQVTTGTAGEPGDVYSAGILLYEMLTGQPPYTGDTLLSVAYRHVNDDVPAPSRAVAAIPAAIDDLVLRATRRDPRARPADAGAFLAELRRVRAELDLSPVPVPVPVPSAPRAAEGGTDLGAGAGDGAAADAGADGTTASETTRGLPAAIGQAPATDGSSTGTPPAGVPGGDASMNEVTMPGFAAATVPAMSPAVPGGPVDPAGPRGTKALLRPAAGHAPGTGPARTPPAAGPQGQQVAAARQEPERASPWYKRWAALWIVAALLVAGGIGAGIWALSGPANVPVPDSVGQQEAAADTLLRGAGLTPQVTRQRHNTVPAGSVVSTDPAPGAEVTEGSTIALVVSSGPPTVPDVAPGTDPAAAEKAIGDAQLTPRRDKPGEYSPDVPAGTVLRLEPQPGSRANIGDPVSLVLSNGPAPIQVPDVAGQGKDAAFAALQAAGFAPFEAGQEFAENVPAGAVTRTEPGAGTTVDTTNNKVGVYVSNAAEMPTVVGRTTRDAVAELQSKGFQIEGADGSAPAFSFVIDQQPAPGTRLPAGSTVRLRTIP